MNTAAKRLIRFSLRATKKSNSYDGVPQWVAQRRRDIVRLYRNII